MKPILFLLLFILLPGYNSAQNITGHWNGTYKSSVGDLRIIFDIDKLEGKHTVTMQLPDQNARPRPISNISYQNNKITISDEGNYLSYNGTLINDTLIKGTLKMNNSTYQISLTHRYRPQTPMPPFPYKEEYVRIYNIKDSIYLAGTLTLPDTIRRHPAVVLITGSGGQNRNEEMMEHEPFWIIADYLSRRGIAVLRVDDRGIGLSEGKYLNADIYDFANDTEAAFEYLKTHKAIHSKRIGLIGHSLGGLLSFTIAGRRNDISFIVSLAGASIPGYDIAKDQIEKMLLPYMPDSIKQYLRAFQKQILDIQIQDKPREEVVQDINEALESMLFEDNSTLSEDSLQSMKKDIMIQAQSYCLPQKLSTLKHNPIPDLRKVKCPVFAINGDKDVQVTADLHLPSIEKNIRSNGNTQVTTKIYPNLNHLFQHCQTGQMDEYIEIEETISEEVLKDITDWILKTVDK